MMIENPKETSDPLTPKSKQNNTCFLFSICARETPIIPHAQVGSRKPALPLLFSCQNPPLRISFITISPSFLHTPLSFSLNVSSLFLPLNFSLSLQSSFPHINGYGEGYVTILSGSCFPLPHQYCKWGSLFCRGEEDVQCANVAAEETATWWYSWLPPPRIK